MENKKAPKPNWYLIAKYGVAFAKFLLLLFSLFIVATLTADLVQKPYANYFIGIEAALALMIAFDIIRRNRERPKNTIVVPEAFNETDEQARLLWLKLMHDINRYKDNSSYYFSSVKFYKYSTIVLAGISTVILGLDLGDPEFFLPIGYTIFSKNVALVIGAIITVSTSLMTYWNIEKYWLINKTIVNKLKALRDDVEDANAAKILDQAAISNYVKKHGEIKETFNKYWEGALSERGK